MYVGPRSFSRISFSLPPPTLIRRSRRQPCTTPLSPPDVLFAIGPLYCSAAKKYKGGNACIVTESQNTPHNLFLLFPRTPKIGNRRLDTTHKKAKKDFLPTGFLFLVLIWHRKQGKMSKTTKKGSSSDTDWVDLGAEEQKPKKSPTTTKGGMSGNNTICPVHVRNNF